MPIEIPPKFMCVPYDGARHPGAAGFDSSMGANCQLWAYAVLNHFGFHVPPLRSSELWEDTQFSEPVRRWEPLDLLFFNDAESAWGAHVAVYLGDDLVAHLSGKLGFPATCRIEAMLRNPKYRVLIGAK